MSATGEIRPFSRAGSMAPRGNARALCLFAASSAVALLSTTALAAGSCSIGNPGATDYVCSGTFGAFSSTIVTTLTLTGAATGGGYVSAQNTTGADVTFSMDSGSSVAATTLPTSGDALTVTASGGSVSATINGAVSSPGGTAVELSSNGASKNVNLTTGGGGTITSKFYGIYSNAWGSGATNMTLNGAVTSTVGGAVYAGGSAGAINITANAAISGGYYGIEAFTNTGAGAVNVSGAGAVASTSGAAVTALSATGNVSINLGGALTGADSGLIAQSNSGDVTVTTGGAVTGAKYGVNAFTQGVGALTVTTSGNVKATTGVGVTTTGGDGVSSVSIGSGGVTAATDGVDATSLGKGMTKVAIHGNVTGTSGVGVSAASSSGAVQIDLDTGTFVTGGKTGLAVSTQSGAATIDNGATISGPTAVTIDANAGAAAFNNSGALKAGAGGSAIDVLSGVATLTNSGAMNGQVTRVPGSVVTLSNSGVWTNAAGSAFTNFVNTGTVSFGPAGGAPGVITVVGDAAFGAGSAVSMRLTSKANDAFVISGAATIAGGVVNLSATGGGFTKGMTFTLLTASKGVTGGFTGVASGISNLAGIVTGDANGVYVTLLNRDFTGYALNRNQYAVSNAVWIGSAVLTSGPGAQLLEALNNLPAASVPGALTQLSGDGVVTGAEHAALQAGHLFASALSDQEDIWNSGIRGAGNSITLTEPFAYAPMRTPDSRWPVSRQHYAPPPPRPLFVQRTWRVWASGFGGETKLHGDAGDGSSGQRATAIGGAMGVDYQFGERMLLGVSGGYSSSSFSASDTNVSGAIGGLHIGLYSGFHVGAFYANANVAYGNYSNSTTRMVSAIGGLAAETDKANYTSEELRTRLEVGRKMSIEAMSITPFTAIEIAHIHAHGFSEYGISAAGGPGVYTMAFNGQGARSIPTFIGLKVESRFEAGNVALTPWVSIAWRHEWTPTSTQTGMLTALPTAGFMVYGAKPSSDTLQIKAGAQIQIARNAALYAAFEGDLFSKNPVYGGRGGVRIGW